MLFIYDLVESPNYTSGILDSIIVTHDSTQIINSSEGRLCLFVASTPTFEYEDLGEWLSVFAYHQYS